MNMTLQNLVGISLEQITPAKDTIKRLIEAAVRHIADAKVQAVSAETRSLAKMHAWLVQNVQNGFHTSAPD